MDKARQMDAARLWSAESKGVGFPTDKMLRIWQSKQLQSSETKCCLVGGGPNEILTMHPHPETSFQRQHSPVKATRLVEIGTMATRASTHVTCCVQVPLLTSCQSRCGSGRCSGEGPKGLLVRRRRLPHDHWRRLTKTGEFSASCRRQQSGASGRRPVPPMYERHLLPGGPWQLEGQARGNES